MEKCDKNTLFAISVNIMAYNYLEKREEALRSAGRTVIRRNTPSLDTLLL